MKKSECNDVLSGAISSPTSLKVHHGGNSVDGASGPGWLHIPSVSGEHCGAPLRGVSTPRLQEYSWSKNLGDGYSEGRRTWVTTAADIMAVLPEAWPEVTEREIRASVDLNLLPHQVEYRREKMESLRPRWESAVSAIKAEISALPPSQMIVWDSYSW